MKERRGSGNSPPTFFRGLDDQFFCILQLMLMGSGVISAGHPIDDFSFSLLLCRVMGVPCGFPVRKCFLLMVCDL